MITVLIPGGDVAVGQEVELDASEAHHLKVRRAADDQAVRLRDGAGLVGVGQLRVTGRQALVTVADAKRVARPAPLTLAVGAGDRDRFALLAEKAAELGVTDLVPLDTERTAGVATRLRREQVERLRRRALDALKQCGAAWAPVIHPLVPVLRFLGEVRDGCRWLADPAGELPPAALGAEHATVVVGPEGGLTGGERAAALEAGYTPVALGAHILRFETAAIAAAAAVHTARIRGGHG